jgi:hypothetical protein
VEGQLSDLIHNIDINKLDTNAIEGIDTREKAHLLKSIEWLYNNNYQRIDREQQELIQKLRVAVSKEKTEVAFDQLQSQDFQIHYPARAGLNYVYSYDASDYLKLDFRIGLHDFEDDDTVFPKYDYLNLFQTEILLSQQDIQLNEFWLFHQSSRQPSNKMVTYSSWDLGMGAKRYYFGKNTLLAGGVFSTLGKSFNIVHKRWNTSPLLGVNAVYRQDHKAGVLLNPKLENRFFLSDNIKMLISLSNPIFSQKPAWENPQLESDFYLRLQNNLSIRASLNLREDLVQSEMGISWNIPLLN